MRRAFVMITSETGAEDEVLKALEEIPEVREIHQRARATRRLTLRARVCDGEGI